MNDKIITLDKKTNNDDNYDEAEKFSLSLSEIKKEVSCTLF